ncbi:MAG TPA: hypothetical protein VGJ84_11260 [Polyangiaceae bacterium]
MNIRMSLFGTRLCLSAVAILGCGGGGNAGPSSNGNGAEPGSSVGLTPLTDLTGTYKGEPGGLYPGGGNQLPAAVEQAAQRMSARIQPRDATGAADPTGQVALISIGMSNTTAEFSTFKQLADGLATKSNQLVIVDGAQGGMDVAAWAVPDAQPWQVLDQRLQAAAVSPAQVQVAWIKHAKARPTSDGEFPDHAQRLKENLVTVLNLAKQRFQNLQVVYLSSRIYAGFASTPLNPEPYAYESAFSVRWLIDEQQQGRPELAFDPGPAPLVLWGPYLWADGIHARSDGLSWPRSMFADDGTHPSQAGREQVAGLLLDYFASDVYARGWLLTAQ